jgi:predicted lactoylglutathione lyase
MKTKIFISLPVADLPRSLAFFQALGYAQNPELCDDTFACFTISDEISLMLMTHAKFLVISPKAVCDTTKYNEVLFCLCLDSRQQVDDMVAKAVAAGGTTFEEAEDNGFMYSHSFIDPDGHGWSKMADYILNDSPKCRLGIVATYDLRRIPKRHGR